MSFMRCSVICSVLSVMAAGVMAAVPLTAYAGQYTTATGEESDPGQWRDDISGKIDKTIEVLSVVKEELKDLDEDDLEQISSGDVDMDKEGWADRLRKKISAAVRVWNKMRKAAAKMDESSVPAADQEDDARDKEWAEDMDKKLDKTIEAITVIKEELKKVDRTSGEDSR